MRSADALVVGGGPAGSSCAWRLREAGLDVVVMDKAVFPRDKVCAGWITPEVVTALALDLADYGRALTLQPFTGFRAGPFTRAPMHVDFEQPISWGIRRCEFDAYLLRRSGATLLLGRPLRTLRREGRDWIANDEVRAKLIIGAGGHFCPVARQLGGQTDDDPVVTAQEIEFRLDAEQAAACPVQGSAPELYFWPDLRGYGWCVRKGDYLNVGAGRLGSPRFPAAVREFVAMLETRRRLPRDVPAKWKGHAYLLNRSSHRVVYQDGAVLVGDAAGLAFAPSGEGILTAVESGVMAARVIVEAAGRYDAERLAPYGKLLEGRFGRRPRSGSTPWDPPPWLATAAARAMFASRRLTRRVLIEDWFLHGRRQASA